MATYAPLSLAAVVSRPLTLTSMPDAAQPGYRTFSMNRTGCSTRTVSRIVSLSGNLVSCLTTAAFSRQRTAEAMKRLT